MRAAPRSVQKKFRGADIYPTRSLPSASAARPKRNAIKPEKAINKRTINSETATKGDHLTKYDTARRTAASVANQEAR
jgi:hypothetical protein